MQTLCPQIACKRLVAGAVVVAGAVEEKYQEEEMTVGAINSSTGNLMLQASHLNSMPRDQATPTTHGKAEGGGVIVLPFIAYEIINQLGNGATLASIARMTGLDQKSIQEYCTSALRQYGATVLPEAARAVLASMRADQHSSYDDA